MRKRCVLRQQVHVIKNYYTPTRTGQGLKKNRYRFYMFIGKIIGTSSLLLLVFHIHGGTRGRPPSATPSQSYYSDDFGNRRFGFPPTPSDPPNACASTIPHPTDGNYMCFPELKRVTNPLNPYFYRNNLKDIHGDTIGGGSDFQAHLKSAHYSHDARVLDEGDIYEPELMNIRSGCRSNHNPINPLSNGGAGGG